MKEARRIIFVSRKCHFIFTLPTLEKTPFFYQSFPKHFPSAQVERGVSLPSFSPLKSQQPSSSRSPGLPQQLLDTLRVKCPLPWKRWPRERVECPQHSAAWWMTVQLGRWVSPKPRGLEMIAKQKGFDGLNDGPQLWQCFWPCIQSNT